MVDVCHVFIYMYESRPHNATEWRVGHDKRTRSLENLVACLFDGLIW